jgi:ABC-type nitrate/sulfonate/bicarbonate transport system substrate-binding protein
VDIPAATKTSWIPTVQAWKGKKIGVPAIGGTVDLYTRYLVRKAGLDPGTDVKIVATGAGAAAVAALQQGIVDITANDTSVRALLEARKIGHTVIDSDAGQGPAELQDTFITGWLTSDAQIQEDPALYRAVVNALVRVRAYMAKPSSKRDLIDLLNKKIGFDLPTARLVYKYANHQRVKAPLNGQIFNKTISAYLATGVMTGTPPTYADTVAEIAR